MKHFTLGVLLVFASVLLGEFKTTHGASLSQITKSQSNKHGQYLQQDKDDSDKEESAHNEDEQDDPYQLLNDLKHERDRLPHYPWNPFAPNNDIFRSNKYYPYIGYPQPIYIPYPVLVTPEMLYSMNGAGDEDDSMSRANVRRMQPPYRNSPIYYVRLPPSPYAFIPGMGYTSPPTTFSQSYAPSFNPSFVPFNSYNTPAPMRSVINLPINFLANGKPGNIFQLNNQPDHAEGYPSLTPARPFRPNAINQQQYPSPSESKVTSLKGPFVFNGRPEDIFLLQNNFNPIQSLYQDAISPYY